MPTAKDGLIRSAYERDCRRKFPRFYEELVPSARKATDFAKCFPSGLMILTEIDFPLSMDILSLASGDLDLATEISYPLLRPPVTTRLKRAVRAVRTSRHEGVWLAVMGPIPFEFIYHNLDHAEGLERLLDRYGRIDESLLEIAAAFPGLAGSSPDLVREFASLCPGPIAWGKIVGAERDRNLTPIHLSLLISIFGTRWREWVKRIDGRGPEEEGAIHEAAAALFPIFPEMFTKFPRSHWRGLSDLLLANVRRPIVELRAALGLWPELVRPKVWPDLRVVLKGALGLDADVADVTLDMFLASSEYRHGYSFREAQAMRGAVEEVVRDSSVAPQAPWTAVSAKMGGLRGHFLSHDDPRGLNIGNLVGNCQHLGGAASQAALHSCLSPQGAVFVVEGAGKILAASWAWSRGDVVVFDDAEGPAVRGKDDARTEAIVDVYKAISGEMVSAGLARSVLLGICDVGLRPKFVEGLRRWEHAEPREPEDYKGMEERLETMGLHGIGPYAPDSLRGKVVLAGRLHPRQIRSFKNDNNGGFPI